jgi:hypothetical protein
MIYSVHRTQEETPMKRIGMVHVGTLSLLLIATAGFGYAQHDDRRGGQDRQDHQGQQSDEQRGNSEHHQQAQRQQEQYQRMQESQQRDYWQQRRANNFESQRQSWTQRGGYRGDRVRDMDFRQRFGRRHSFRVSGLPYREVGGQSRFQYGGYWFNMMDPYPEYWGANWYRDDDVYVDYNDGGYYLYNRRYPRRPGVAISLSF